MGWLKDWKHRRVLARHSIDHALWNATVASLPFLQGLSAEEMQRLRDMALGRFGRAEEVAEAVVFLLSDRASLFLGQTLNPNAGGYMP